jgi:multidrug transporter EmrE-like cation transporter
MTPKSLLLTTIILRTLTDVSFKLSVNDLKFDSMKSILPNLKKIFCSLFLWAGIIFGTLNAAIWSLCLTHFDLSYAYPFMSIAFVSIILCGKLFFKEHLDAYKLWGIGFIILGAIILFIE